MWQLKVGIVLQQNTSQKLARHKYVYKSTAGNMLLIVLLKLASFWSHMWDDALYPTVLSIYIVGIQTECQMTNSVSRLKSVVNVLHFIFKQL